MTNSVKFEIMPDSAPEKGVTEKVRDFLKKFQPLELDSSTIPLLLMDPKSQSYYLICHLNSETLASRTDIDAVLDPQESEDYKLNRDIYTDTYAYKVMESDAVNGRAFEDIVVEYDTSYRPARPLKVFGGQHRITAITEAYKKEVYAFHGIRVYFDLTIEQRLEIATANNTSIAVSNDLLDRMQEELLGSNLRDWCQSVGLLEPKQNFADKRNSAGIPTVRVARSLVVNFFKGAADKLDGDLNPVVCASGPGIDQEYTVIREKIDWSNSKLKKMGQEFVKLHKLQRERVLHRTVDSYLEYANKAMHPCVVSSWSYAAGLLQKDAKALSVHFGLPQSVSAKSSSDPLNAKALSAARLKGVDPDTYRGLGARINSTELGRMLEVFILQATKARKLGITLKLANAAIQSYEARRAQIAAFKAIKRI
jgi:hypothetical protein